MIIGESMNQYRQTYAEINLKQIEKNVSLLIKTYPDYQYYFGVVKADSYGHYDYKVIKSIIKGGCNYLAVSSLDEAVEIRKKIKEIPILCFGVVLKEYLDVCVKENITITIPSFEYAMEIPKKYASKLKCHIKLDTGMNRLGIKNGDELEYTYSILKERGFYIEGIYTHIYHASKKKRTKEQFRSFEELTKNINLNEIPIVHVAQSETVTQYSKLSFVNGCRLGIAMYGYAFGMEKEIGLKSTFSLKSQIVQIKHLKKGELVGYNGIYKATKNEIIGIVCIGYADGILRSNTGRTVFIKGREYPIVGNICMDMLMVRIDELVSLYDVVDILKDMDDIKRVADYLKTIPYEIICGISKRVPRIYVKRVRDNDTK